MIEEIYNLAANAHLPLHGFKSSLVLKKTKYTKQTIKKKKTLLLGEQICYTFTFNSTQFKFQKLATKK